MHHKKSFWIVLIILVLVAGGGYYTYANAYLPSQTPDEPAIQTAKVRTGDIVVSASGAGMIVPAIEIDLGFRSGGALVEVLAQVGDKVQAGDVLARLDDTAARQAVANAELQVAQAAIQTDADTVQRVIALGEIDVTQAEINLTAAQAKLDELLNWEP
ncbi:MAG: biotin/lipoyl-binding protein, partial [Anaerolineae bacterium]